MLYGGGVLCKGRMCNGCVARRLVFIWRALGTRKSKPTSLLERTAVAAKPAATSDVSDNVTGLLAYVVSKQRSSLETSPMAGCVNAPAVGNRIGC